MAGFWMYETSGKLRPVIERYLQQEPLSEQDIAAMRAYLRQWVMEPRFIGDDIDDLRKRVSGLTTRKLIADWIKDAIDANIDPL